MSFLIKYLWEERWTQHLALPNSDGQVDKKHFTCTSYLLLYFFKTPRSSGVDRICNDFGRMDPNPREQK